VSDDDPHSTGARAIARRLEALYANVHPAGRGPYSDEEVAARAAARGFDLSRAYIQQLRRGRRINPTVKALEGLAAAFDVPVSYFFSDDQLDIARQDRALAAAVEDEAVRDIALRSAQLTPEGVRALSALLRGLENQGPTSPETQNGNQRGS